MCTTTEPAGQVDAPRERRPVDAKPETYVFILPVLFVEFLAIAVTKRRGRGAAETVKGIFAFVACPLFGRLSDVVGRTSCLLVTVVGTTAPCWILAFTDNLWAYVCALGLSGLFASTFTLVFAYIADVVEATRRAPAYGAALATLGLSFTVGPVLGAFAARRVGDRRVFLVALALAILDVLIIGLALPESNEGALRRRGHEDPSTLRFFREGRHPTPAFDPLDALAVFRGDPFLRRVALIVLLYYSGVWALVTTIVVYVVRVFGLSKIEVGWLLSAYGLSTMVAEGVLVRVLVPRLGELGTLRIGLLAFAMQCALIAVATTPGLIFARNVPEKAQGEALGAINGVKALTEGVGPLCFAALMAKFERTRLPGTPYLACAAVSALAWVISYQLPAESAYAAYRDRGDAGDHELGTLSPLSTASPRGFSSAATSGDDASDDESRSTRSSTRANFDYRPPLTTAAAAFRPAHNQAAARDYYPHRGPSRSNTL
ncbi:hypothetical protein JL721_6867 [Aureococcus anophagefferens]|nr:hypothetical protein JL721_6867 [Aureococcus anophagefferens]